MKNSNELEKSKGVVVFAFNTGEVDYVSLADKTSRLTNYFLNLPITLITDQDADPKFAYDNVIRVESKLGNFRVENNNKKTWKNFDRYKVYELSPYDTTILLDGDYLTLDQSLLSLLDQDFDYRLMHDSHNFKSQLYKQMGSYGLPFVWATVVIFKKSDKTKQYFDLIGRIQNNYAYYKTLYNCNGSYRNDYAFAIADIILNGYSIDSYKSIPWSMLTVEDAINDIELKNDFLIIRQENQAHVIAKQNIHVMDKKFLMSDKFENFVKNVIK